MADDLFLHADLVAARAAIDAAARVREEAVAKVRYAPKGTVITRHAKAAEATHAELRAFVEAKRRLQERSH